MIKNQKLTAIEEIAKRGKDPFRVLISTLISARTKDEVTHVASERLFSQASTPAEMKELLISTIEELIYPAGFYRNKAKFIQQTCEILDNDYQGSVPKNVEELVKLPGVGRKTANLVLGLAFNIPAICVDTHVHRIANRWGYISTKTPEKSEFALMEVLPKTYWIDINGLLVAFGQNICTPISPKCSQCELSDRCAKINVEKSR